MAYQECRGLEVCNDRATETGARPGARQRSAITPRYVSLPTTEGSVEAALQAAINERAKLGWKLISVAKEPSSYGLFLVWGTSGFFSG